MNKHSFVQIYTGNGKGKTTAAMGLMLRALGAGKKVCFLQFMKSLDYSEHNIMQNLSENLYFETVGKPYFIGIRDEIPPDVLKKLESMCVVFEKGHPPDEYVELVAKGLARAKEFLESGEYDLVILDEICCAVYFGLTTDTDVIEIIESRDPYTEVVLTGRNASEKLIDYADLVTDMREVKHYYKDGVYARRGIEN